LQHFVADFDLDIVLLSEFPWSPGDQVIDVADNLADIIGYSSSGIRREGTALEGRDFEV
jgi:hypothetical protein